MFSFKFYPSPTNLHEHVPSIPDILHVWTSLTAVNFTCVYPQILAGPGPAHPTTICCCIKDLQLQLFNGQCPCTIELSNYFHIKLLSINLSQAFTFHHLFCLFLFYLVFFLCVIFTAQNVKQAFSKLWAVVVISGSFCTFVCRIVHCAQQQGAFTQAIVSKYPNNQTNLISELKI